MLVTDPTPGSLVHRSQQSSALRSFGTVLGPLWDRFWALGAVIMPGMIHAMLFFSGSLARLIEARFSSALALNTAPALVRYRPQGMSSPKTQAWIYGTS